jgi:hypothetical protein
MDKTEVDTRALPDDVCLPGHRYTLGEMRETIKRMRQLNETFYWAMFQQDMGGRCHAFVEFAGLQAKFIDMCEAALNQGIEFPLANQHSGQPWPLDVHHAEYLGEKFACIYGFAIGSRPELRRVFIASGLGEIRQRDHNDRPLSPLEEQERLNKRDELFRRTRRP